MNVGMQVCVRACVCVCIVLVIGSVCCGWLRSNVDSLCLFPMRVGEVVEKRFLTHKVEDVWEVRG